MSDFKVKFALQKRSQTSPKSIMALQNMKKWTKYLYDILVYARDTAQLMGESTRLVKIPKCRPNTFLHSAHLSETDFCIVIIYFCKRRFSKSRSFNWMQTKCVLSPISCAVSQAYIQKKCIYWSGQILKYHDNIFCSFFHLI